MVSSRIELAFVPSEPLDADQFIALADKLGSNLNVTTDWEARFQFAAAKNLQEVGDWQRRLRDHWRIVSELSLECYASPGTRIVRWDVPSQTISNVAFAQDDERLDEVASRISAGTALQRLTHDPLRYRRSAIVYRPKHWSRSGFEDGIRKVLEQANDGLPVHVQEACITFEKNNYRHVELLEGDEDVDSFFNTLNKLDSLANKLHTVHLSITGATQIVDGAPRGLGLGFTVELFPRPHQVTVRSTLEPADLARVLEPLSSALKLGQPVEASVGGSDASSGGPKFSERWLVQHLLNPIVALPIGIVAAAFAGWGWMAYLMPQYSVKIATPVATEGVFTMPPGTLTLNWYLAPENWSVRGFVYAPEAELRILKNGGSYEQVTAVGSYEFPVEMGSYTIFVSSTEREAAPAAVKIVVKPQAQSTDVSAD